MFLTGACGVYWTHDLINVIADGFNGSHFEFQVNQESEGYFNLIIGFLIHKNMDLEVEL